MQRRTAHPGSQAQAASQPRQARPTTGVQVSKQIWRVYTSQNDEVHSTLWTENGPQGPVSVIKIEPSPEAAAAQALRMQRRYDQTRQGMGV